MTLDSNIFIFKFNYCRDRNFFNIPANDVKKSTSTPIRMPPEEPIEGRFFQQNVLLPTMDFRKLSEISSFLVS
jgi:hypothetical protein